MIKQITILLFLFLFLSKGKAQINTPTPTIPFGTNTSYAGGILPTNKSQTDATNAYNTWKSNYVRACGSNSRVLFDDGTSTVSEGIGYGMLLAAYAGDKALLDGLWGYYKSTGNSQYGGLMDWKIGGCSGATGTGPATDADEDAAWALIVAAYQWPTATSPYNYTTEANNLITQIGNREITNGQANNGASWGSANTCRNPSYQAPAYYRQFATQVSSQASIWNGAVTGSYSLLNSNVNSSTGLVSNWSDNNGSHNNCNGTDEYGSDACRNPWRMAMDVIWNNTTSTQTNFCNKIAAYCQSHGATSVGGNVPQSGGTGNHYPMYIATFAAGICGASSTYQTLLNQMYTETVNKTDNPPLYFGNTLRCLSLFMMTGNFWKPGATQNNNGSVTVNITSPASGTGISEGTSVTINATATTTSGTITKVDFMNGSTLLGSDASSPYSLTLNNLAPGTYTIKAVATNSNAQTQTSSAITITVYKAIPQTGSAPVIDGNGNDAVWSSITPVSISQLLSGTVTGSADLSGNWSALWDAQNLYILVNVTDDAKVNNSGTDVYNDDGVEVYVDIGNDKATTYGSNDFQYTFRWNDATVYESHSKSVSGITKTLTATANGYVAEISIPWSTLTGSPAVNQLVGFDVMINDDDDGGARDAKISWNASTDDEWNNPSLMGTVILKGSSCTTPPVANAGSDKNITSNSTTLAANNPSPGTGTWTVVGGTASFVNASSPTTQVNNLGNGANTLRWTVTNGSCPSSSDDVIISVGNVPNTSSISGPQTVSANQTNITYSVTNNNGSTYQWQATGDIQIVNSNGSTVTVNVGTAGGTLTVTETNSYGQGTPVSVTVSVSTAVQSGNAIGESAIYPNPFQDETIIKITSASTSLINIRVVDLNGKDFMNLENQYTNNEIHLGKELPAGVYLIHAIQQDKVQVARLVKLK